MDFDHKFFRSYQTRQLVKDTCMSASAVFEYEHYVTKKVNKNIENQTTEQLNYLSFLIVKIKIRDEVLRN